MSLIFDSKEITLPGHTRRVGTTKYVETTGTEALSQSRCGNGKDKGDGLYVKWDTQE